MVAGSVLAMEMTLEVLVVPVSDVERSREFYADKLGFNVDTDAQLSEDFRVARGPRRRARLPGLRVLRGPGRERLGIQQLSQSLGDWQAALAAADGPRGAPETA